MKKKMVLISMFLTGLVIWGCTEKSSTNQTVSLYIEATIEYGVIEDLNAFGKVVGDPFPILKTVSVNGLVRTLEYPAPWNDPMEINKDSFLIDLEDESKTEKFEFDIATSEGNLSGHIKKSTLYDSITVSAKQAMNLGESWTMTIHGGKSDFVAISATLFGLPLDTIITGSTFSIPASRLNQNGYLTIWEVSMINGPMQNKGAKGNISGDGGGFIWYSSESDEGTLYNVRVGSGSIATRPKTLSREALRTRRSNLIKKQME